MTEQNVLARQSRAPSQLARAAEMTLEQVAEVSGYTPAQVALVSQTVAVGAPLVELAVFLHACSTLHLDPLLRQAYWIRRKNRVQLPSGEWGDEYRGALQVGIDGFRALADRQGNYAGSETATYRGQIEWTYKGKTYVVPEYASVVCWKIVQGHKAAFTGEARWVEFVPSENQAQMWARMPRLMLAKCAEGQALRKGWPALLGSIQMADDLGEGELPSMQGSAVMVSELEPSAEYGIVDARNRRTVERHYEEKSEAPRRTVPPDMYDRAIVSNYDDKPSTTTSPPMPQGAVAARAGAELLERNKQLVNEAAGLRVPGLPRFTANNTWPADKVSEANDELVERIRARAPQERQAAEETEEEIE